jgi:ribosomal protein S12 methylthiotransferase
MIRKVGPPRAGLPCAAAPVVTGLVRGVCEIVGRYWLQTLGCPKNEVDSDKLEGYLEAQGFDRATDPEAADLVVVNTCAFIEAARQESIDTILHMVDRRRAGARLVVTGCLAERYGDELHDALPEVDLVAGFGHDLAAAPAPVPVSLGASRTTQSRPSEGAVSQNYKQFGLRFSQTSPRGPSPVPTPTPTPAVKSFDLLELPRPAARAPWAYVKVAEGCDRICGFCAIPSFRGKQRSRPRQDVLAEVEALLAQAADEDRADRADPPDATAPPPLREVVLVAQDLASYGRDRTGPNRRTTTTTTTTTTSPIAALTRAVQATGVERTRLLYLYPSGLADDLVSAILDTKVPYFDLSLQHVSRPHLARMRRWGDGERFLQRIQDIRKADPHATFRSSFILGYPGETERDHDLLLQFLEAAQLDWAGFFTFSEEEGTHAAGLPDQIPPQLALERLRECAELQDAITAAKRDRLIGQVRRVLVDAPGRGRTVHEAPEIDGVVHLPATDPHLRVGSLVDLRITGAEGPDLHGAPVHDRDPVATAATAATPVTTTP